MALIKLLKEYSNALKILWNPQNKEKSFKSITPYQVGNPKRDPNTKIAKTHTIKVGMNIFLFAVLLALLAGCGEDNPQNSGGNPPPPVNNNDSLVYTLDSLSLYGTGDTTYFFHNGITPIVIGDSIKITLTISSNCLISDTASASVFLGGFFQYAFTMTPNQFNMNHVFTHLVFSNFSEVNYSLYFNSFTRKFIKLSNIKFYKCYN